MVKRNKPLPAPVARVLTRIMPADGGQLILARLGDQALIRTARWIRAKDREPFDGFHVRAPLLMQRLDDAVKEPFRCWDGRFLTRALFAIGLVVGCHLRDQAEGEEPTTRCVGFEAALDQLDTSATLNLLTASCWPDDLTPCLTLIDTLARRCPPLGDRMLLVYELAHSLPGQRRDTALHFHFLLGLIGAGIGVPDPLWDHPESWSYSIPRISFETLMEDRILEYEEYHSKLPTDLDEDFDDFDDDS